MKLFPLISIKAPSKWRQMTRWVMVFAIAALLSLLIPAGQGKWMTDGWIISVLNKPLSWTSKSMTAVQRFVQDYFFLVGIKGENRELHDQVDALRMQNLLLTAKNDFLQGVVAMRGITDGLQKEHLIGARILGYDALASSKTVLIDAGRRQGVEIDDVVMAADGLAGRVVKVFEKSSQVLLICDPHFAIDVANSRTGVRLMLTGVLENRLKGNRYPFLTRAEFIEKSGEVRAGDELVTSGLGDVFPASIPVGKVIEVRSSSEKVFERLVVQPVVDFAKLNYVFILSQSEQKSVTSQLQ